MRRSVSEEEKDRNAPPGVEDDGRAGICVFEAGVAAMDGSGTEDGGREPDTNTSGGSAIDRAGLRVGGSSCELACSPSMSTER